MRVADQEEEILGHGRGGHWDCCRRYCGWDCFGTSVSETELEGVSFFS